jgi:hypothetical protein
MRLRSFACVLSVCATLPLVACSGATFEVAAIDEDAALDAGGDTGGGDVFASEVGPDAPVDSSDVGVDSTLIDAGDTGAAEAGDAADAAADTGDSGAADATDAADSFALDAPDATDAADASDTATDAGDAGCTTGATRPCYTGTDPTRVGHGICHAGTSSCMGGIWGTCLGDQTPQAETCNGADDNCDDVVDNAPGTGTDCSGGVGGGACVARTMCMKSGGAWLATPQCVGTFVSPNGTASSGGSPTQPLNTITAAIANAQALGGGADVCVCAAGGATALFTEKVKMVEGTSVLGSYDCATWTRPATLPTTPLTAIQDVDAEGVLVPAGVTSATAIDGMSVRGFTTAAAVSSALSVVDASPVLNGLYVSGATAPTAVGLAVTSSTAGKSAPTVTGGTYSAVATTGGTQTGIVLQGAAAKLSGVTVANAAVISSALAQTSVGLRCIGCAGTTISRSTFTPGGATTTTKGLWASGDLTGFSVDAGTANQSTFNGGTITGPTASGGAPSATSVQLESCTGNPRFDNARLNGGSTTSAIVQTARLVGLDASGGTCAASFTAGFIRGCEAGGNCFGALVDAAPVSFVGLTSSTFAGILGTSSTATYQAIGLRCTNGGCRSVTGSHISAGGVGAGSTTNLSAGLSLDHSAPTFDANVVTAPACGNTGMPTGPLYGAHLLASSARLTNSVFRDGVCNAQEEVVFVGKSAVGPAALSSDLINDTIEYGNCASVGCGTRMGLSFDQAGIGGPIGHFDNNIVRNVFASSGGGSYKSFAVYQYGLNGDWATFSANDLWDANAWNGGNPVLFYWHGLTSLATAGAVNTTLGVAAPKPNLSGDPLLDATWHLLAGSICIDAADATSAPRTDRDGQARPSGAGYDIGADEK